MIRNKMSTNDTKTNRMVHKEQSDLHTSTLNDPRTRTSLATIREVLRTCYGPHGKIHMIHNNVGGHVTLTGCSGRLLSALSVNNSLVRIVTTSMEAHLGRHSDGGLFCGLLSLLLVENSLKLENDSEIHRHLLTDINEVLLSECLQCLNSEGFKAKFDLDFSNMTMPMKFIKTSLQTKLVSCGLTNKDLDHFAPLILKTFLEVYSPTGNLGTIHYLTVEGMRTTESKLFNGVLFEMPSIPTYRKDPLNVKRISDGAEVGQIRVALVSTSMSGDTEELPDATYELSHNQGITDVVLRALMCFAEKLVELEVGLLACQKVVHPRVKRLLRESGVHVMDRLGRKFIDAVKELSGAQLIGSFTTDPDSSMFGTLDTAEHVVIQKKSYIQLNGSSACAITLLLSSYSEEATQELKYVVKSCIDNLGIAMNDNRILCAGGCWMTVLAHQLRQQIEQKLEGLSTELCSTKYQLLAALNVFTRSLEQLALPLGHTGGDHLIDMAHHHYWSAPLGCISAQDWSYMVNKSCQCGAITNTKGNCDFSFVGDNVKMAQSSANDVNAPMGRIDKKSVQLWDSLPLYSSALQTAVLTANMLLGVHSYIQNTN